MDTAQTPHHPRKPSRRIFLQNGLAAIATALLVGIGSWAFLTPDSAQAREYKIPRAILAQSEKFDQLADAWFAYHTKTGDNENRTGEATAKIIMDLVPGRIPTSGRKINKEKALMESYGYHLLGRKMRVLFATLEWLEANLKPENPQLFYYSEGVRDIYGNRNREARENFAKGIFAAAGLTPKDYERLKKVGIQVEWQGAPDNWLRNAERLGRQFVDMDLEQKEKVLNIGIGQKQNYDEEGVYWNLGFYINREYILNSKVAGKIDREESKTGLYYQLFNKYKFDTMTKKLII